MFKGKLMNKWRDRTKSGYEYIIHTENGKDKDFPLVGEVDLCNQWMAARWDKNGRSSITKNCDLVPQPDYDEFAAKVFLTSPVQSNEQVYNNARRWFIDHPEELK